MHDHNSHDHNQTQSEGTKKPLDESTAFCPVMKDMKVNKEEAEKQGLVRVVNGKKYYLCCEGCAADFDADPKQYAK